MACSSKEDEYGYDDSRFKKDVDVNFHCSICYNVLKEPRMCRNNEHIFCLACITRSLNQNSETCPECNEHLTVDTLRRAPRMVNNYLSELKIKCDFASRGCPEYVRVEALKVHIVNCGFAPVMCSNEECGEEINKRDKVHHEAEVCEYRKVICHDCEHMQELVVGLVEMNKKNDEKVETLKENLEGVKKEVICVKDNLFKVNKDVAELTVMLTQIMEKLNKFEVTSLYAPSPNEWQLNAAGIGTVLPGARGSVSMPSSVLRNIKYGPSPGTVKQRRQVRNQSSLECQDFPNQSVLAQASAPDQKQMLGEYLLPIIQKIKPSLAGKITGMILEMDNEKILHMLKCREALVAKVEEAVGVLRAHQLQEQKRRPNQR